MCILIYNGNYITAINNNKTLHILYNFFRPFFRRVVTRVQKNI